MINLVLRLPSLYTPILDIDESQYGEFANKVVDGGLPYVSSIGEKPPLMYYYYIWIFKLFGKNSYLLLHFVTIVWVILSAYFLFQIGRLRWNEGIGVYLALFYSIFSTTHEPKIISTNGEILMNLPIILGVYFVTLFEYGNLKRHNLLLAGIFTGMALLFRLQAGIQMVFLGSYFLIRTFLEFREEQCVNVIINGFLNIVILSLGWVIPILTSVWYLNHLGGDVLKTFLFWNFTFNFQYIKAGGQSIPVLDGIIKVSFFIFFTLPLWYYFIRYTITSIPCLINKIRIKYSFYPVSNVIFNLLWLVFSIIPVFIGGRFYSHYFIQMFPALCLVGAIGVSQIYQLKDKYDFRGIPRKVLVILSIYSVVFFLPRVDQDLTIQALKKFSPSIGKIGVYPEQRWVGEYIKNRTQKEDTIFVWGFATPIYYYADRNCASRFSWTDFLSGRVPGKAVWRASENRNTDYYVLKGTWNQFCQDLNHYQPKYFVDTSTGGYHEYQKYGVNRVYHPSYNLSNILKRFYEKEKVLYGMTIYRLNKKIDIQCR